MGNMNEEVYENKNALPNKLLQANGEITDIAGNVVTNAVDAYANKPALPNKWINPDGSYSTLSEIIAEIIDNDLYIIVEELPDSGEPNKIYLLVNGDKLIEYLWVGSKWDPIGMVEFDISKYSTTAQMEAAIATALNSAETYTDEQLMDYVKNTDYATANEGGAVKVSESVATQVDSRGMLYSQTKTYEDYIDGASTMFVGKGTLENVITGKELINQTSLDDSQEEQNTIIEQLQEDVENLRNAMPSVEGISPRSVLIGTSKNKFKKFIVGGNSEQTQYEGRNLLPEATKETKSSNGITVISDGKGKYKINGTASANTQIYFDLTKSFTTPDETLYAHLRNNVIAPLSITIGNTQTASSPLCSSVNRIMSSVLLTNLLINKIGFIVQNGETVDVEVEPSVELTNAITEYEPFVGGILSPNSDYLQPIHNVVGTIVNKVSNKNFFNKETVTANSYVNANNGEVAFSNNTSSSDYINIENVSNVIISGDTEMRTNGGAFYNSNKEYISGFTTQQIHDGINVPSGSSYVRITTTTELLDAIQLELGTTATPYVPHQEQILPFTLEEGQKLYIEDTLEDDGIHHRKAQGIVHISSIATLPSGNIGGVITTNSLPNKTRKSNNYLLCNKAVFSKISRETGVIYENPGNAIIIGTPTDTLESMREKYDGAIAEYELGEEEIVPYTETQQTQYNAIKQAMSYNDVTIVENNSNDSPAILTVDAIYSNGGITVALNSAY